MSERLIAIGDIHGCHAALDTLLAEISPEIDDTIITLGDHVDRGPDSRGVVDTLIALGKRTNLVSLRGNHEEMMFDVIERRTPHHSWVRYGGVQTLDSYGFDGSLDFLPPEHQHFFGSLVDSFEQGDFFFTHAAYDPELPLDQQSPQMLRWHSLRQSVPGPHINGKTAVVGHTANRDGEILDLGHLICIDTCCYGGGWLTAIDLHTRQLWQASMAGELRS